MCPVCISTTALLLGGFVSTGSGAALLARLKSKRNIRGSAVARPHDKTSKEK